MKMKVLSVVILSLLVTAEAKAKDKVTAYFRPLFPKFGQNSTTKIKIVSGPADLSLPKTSSVFGGNGFAGFAE